MQISCNKGKSAKYPAGIFICYSLFIYFSTTPNYTLKNEYLKMGVINIQNLSKPLGEWVLIKKILRALPDFLADFKF